MTVEAPKNSFLTHLNTLRTDGVRIGRRTVTKEVTQFFYEDPVQFWEELTEDITSGVGPGRLRLPLIDSTTLINRRLAHQIHRLEERDKRSEQSYFLQEGDRILRETQDRLGADAPEETRRFVRDLHLGLFCGLDDIPAPLPKGREELARVRVQTEATAKGFFERVRDAVNNPQSGARGGYDASKALEVQTIDALQDARRHNDETYIAAVLEHAREIFLSGSQNYYPGESQPPQERTETQEAFKDLYVWTHFWLFKRTEKGTLGIAKKASKDVDGAKQYWADYVNRRHHPAYGAYGDYSLAETFNEKHEQVIKQVTKGKDWQEKKWFIAGGIQALVEVVEDSQTNSRQKAWATHQLIRLVTDHPLAVALAKQEQTAGFRQARSLEVLTRFLNALALGHEFSMDGLKVEATTPRHQLLIGLGNLIATKGFEKFTLEQMKLVQGLLGSRLQYLLSTAYAEDARAGDETDRDSLPATDTQQIKREQLKAARKAFIFGTEGIADLLTKTESGDEVETEKAHLILHVLLGGLFAVSPLTGMGLVFNNDRFRAQLQKMGRAESDRLDQAETAVADLGEEASIENKLLAAWKGGAKIFDDLPYDPFPKDDELVAVNPKSGETRQAVSLPTLLEKSFTSRLIVEFLAHMRKHPGAGERGGALFALDPELADNPVSAELFNRYTNLLRQLAESDRFNQGNERQQHIAGAALLILGHILEQHPDNDSFKEPVRKRFIPLLLDVLRKQGSGKYCQPVEDAAVRVLYQCLPYYPQDTMMEYAKEYFALSSDVTNGDPGIVEGGRLANLLIRPLALPRHGSPPVPGEKPGDPVRPIAPQILELLLTKAPAYQKFAGPVPSFDRQFLHAIIGKRLRRPQKSEDPTSPPELHVDPELAAAFVDGTQPGRPDPTGFPIAFIGEAGWIAVDPAQKAALQETLGRILTDNLQETLEEIAPVPATGGEFINFAERMAAETRQQVRSSAQQLTEVVADMVSLSQPLTTAIDAQLASLDEATVKGLTRDLGRDFNRFKKKAGVKEVQAEAFALVAQAVEEIGTAEPIAFVERLLKLTKEHTQPVQIAELAQAIRTLYQEESTGEAGERRTNIGDALTLLALTHARTAQRTEAAETAEVVAKLVEAQAEALSPEVAGQMANLAGAVAVPTAQATAQAKAYESITQALAHTGEMAKLAEALEANILQVEQERLQELVQLRKQYDRLKQAGSKAQVEVLDIAIAAVQEALEARTREVKTAIQELAKVHSQQISRSTQLLAQQQREQTEQQQAFEEWAKKVFGRTGYVNSIHHQCASRLRQLGLDDVVVAVPTMSDLFGEPTADRVKFIFN